MASRHVRTRLVVAMVAIAMAALILTALVSAGLARRNAVNSARDDADEHATVVADEFANLIGSLRRVTGTNVAGPRLRDLVETTLTVSNGGVVGVDADGHVREILQRLLNTTGGEIKLPKGVTASDLDTSTLMAGDRQRGRDGDYVFTAVPLAPVASLTPVVVVSEQIESRPFGQSVGVVLVAGALALAAAALVAAFLARRLTRPVAAMQVTAGRIADGDLAARVDTSHVGRDELGSLARAINRMAEELEAARRHERTFLLSVSHDLRTPLTSIRGYAEAITDGTVRGDAVGHAGEVIQAEARRLERLVADLLDLARLDAHEFSLTPHPVDARAVVIEAVDAFRPAAHEIGVVLDVSQGQPIAADTDAERLKQIVANLVENALKYAEHRVAVGVTTSNGSFVVRVDDDGPGITGEDLPHVFERLYTSRTVPGRRVGTGIGLAIVRELASAMGGDAQVERLEGAGTRFVVTLPARSAV
jgi:two-component system sensor histidine kinase BaeS